MDGVRVLRGSRLDLHIHGSTAEATPARCDAGIPGARKRGIVPVGPTVASTATETAPRARSAAGLVAGTMQGFLSLSVRSCR